MDCTFRELGYVDRCFGRCKPLEHIYHISGLDSLRSVIASGNVMTSYVLINSYDKIREHSSGLKKMALNSTTKLVNLLLPEELKDFLRHENEGIYEMELDGAKLENYLYSVGEVGSNIFVKSAEATHGKYNEQFLRETGKNVAQMTVLLDANKDLEQDKKNGYYNPLSNTDPEETKKILQQVKENVGKTLSIYPFIPVASLALAAENEGASPECKTIGCLIGLGGLAILGIGAFSKYCCRKQL